ncbi:MAG TPA: hypothetical protein O0X70_04155 [Methanocorpusculum sp.]|nr:hypothetical protein [Methanocorpusculum sp.]
MNRVFTRRNVVWAVSLLVFIAIFVCVICNFAVTGYMTWLVYPVSSLILGWILFIPILHLKVQGMKYSLGLLTAVILPYLLVLDIWTQGGWFFTIALPIALAGLAFLWVSWVLWLKLKNRYYLAGVLLILAGLLSLFIWFIVPSPFPWGWLVFGVAALLAVVWIVLTACIRKK